MSTSTPAEAHYGCTPLIMACEEGHVEIINLLLAKEDIDINLIHGTAPLIIGAHHPDVVKLLLDQKGIDVNCQDDFGRTALMRAARWNLLESAKLLLEREDINVNIRNVNIRGNGRGRTALHLACWDPLAIEIANLLLERKDIDLSAGNLDLYSPWGIAFLKEKNRLPS